MKKEITTEQAQAIERTKFKLRDRLAGLSNGALEEVTDMVDDMMVICHSEEILELGELFKLILVDLVMEQEQRIESKAS